MYPIGKKSTVRHMGACGEMPVNAGLWDCGHNDTTNVCSPLLVFSGISDKIQPVIFAKLTCMKKATLLILVSLCLLYFCIGLLLALFGIIDFQTYGMGATVAGGLASILGSLAFLLPKITTDDIKNIELVAIRDLAKISEEIMNKTEELNRRKNELSQKDKDIQELELLKQETEFFIKKAGLLHYLKEQFYFKEKSIADFLDSNERFKVLIDETNRIKNENART